MNATYNAWMKSLSYRAASALAAKSVSRRSKAGSRRWGRSALGLGIEPLESRTLMTTVNVTSNSATPNYLSNVTIAQLDPTNTAVTFRDAVNAADNTGGSNTIVLQTGATYSFVSATVKATDPNFVLNQTGTGINGSGVISPSTIALALGSLANNGGLTQTMAITTSNSAAGVGTSIGTPANNQRGVARASTPDIGAFEATPAGPTISGVSPLVGPITGATLITITGTGFTGATGATVGGAALTSFTVVNDTTITGDTSAGSFAGSADVVVSNGTSATLTGGFTYNPVVTTGSMVLTMTSTTLTISGFGFDTNMANDSVAFSGGSAGTVSTATSTTLNITGLTGLVAGPLTAIVTVNGASSSSAVEVADVEQATGITSAADSTFTVGTAGSFTVTTTGNPASTFSLTGAPAWLSIGSATGIIAGTPPNLGAGPYIFNFTVDAGNGVTPDTTQPFTLTVNQAPAITSATNTTFTIGTSGSFTVTTTGFPVSTLTESGALPAGVTFTDNHDGTATFAGIPAATAAGSYSLTIVAGNNILPSASQSFTLQVNQIPVLTNLAVTAPARSISPGATLQFTAAGTDQTGSPIALGTVTWSLDAGSVGSIDQTGLFTAANVSAAGGTAVVRATSDGQSAIAVITVDSITQPVITVTAFAQLISSNGNTGTLHVQGTVNGSDANLIYTWSIIRQPSVVSSHKLHPAAISGAPLALFSINGTNGAKNTSVTFLAPGAYTLQVVASNGTQSASSQVQLTVDVKPFEAHAKTQATQVSGVQAFGDATSIAGFVLSFTGPLDFVTAQDTRGYRVRRQKSTQKPSLLGQLLGEGDKNQPNTFKIASAVYTPQTDSVTLTLAKPMLVQNGVRRVQVFGNGPHAVVDANGKPVDGNADGKKGGNFTYHLNMSVGKSITYKTSAGDTVKLSLTGPGQIVTLLPTGTNTPVIDLVDTNSATSILTGVLHKGSKSPGYAVLDELNGTADATIQLGSDFHVNQNNGAATV
jgi:Putative Ig domain/IPT/TIG domain/PKD domain